MDYEIFLQIIDENTEKNEYQRGYDVLFARENQKVITFDDFSLLKV